MNILGINAVYHDTAAALLVDGELVVAVEEERFTRIKHGKLPDVDNPHQCPERAIRFCLDYAGLTADDIDHVAYSFDPELRRTRFRAEWWPNPRSEEVFLLRLGQVRSAMPLAPTSAIAAVRQDVETVTGRLREAVPPVPRQTIQTVKDDVEWIRSGMHAEPPEPREADVELTGTPVTGRRGDISDDMRRWLEERRRT